MTKKHTLLQPLFQNIPRHKPTSKRISSPIRIDNFILRKWIYWDIYSFFIGSSYDDGFLISMCEDDRAFAEGVGFGVGGEGLGYTLEIGGGAGVVGCGCPGGGFGFVTDEDIDVRKNFLDVGSEELSDERCGKVHYECLQKKKNSMF